MKEQRLETYREMVYKHNRGTEVDQLTFKGKIDSVTSESTFDIVADSDIEPSVKDAVNNPSMRIQEDKARKRLNKLFGVYDDHITTEQLIGPDGTRLLLWHNRHEQFNAQRSKQEIQTDTLELTQSDKLVAFARDELENFKARQLDRLSTTKDLQEKFGYAFRSGAIEVLRKEGLIHERRQAEREWRTEMLVPSREYSWMIGLLTTSGYINPSSESNKLIELSSRYPELIDAFTNVGQFLFRKSPLVTNHTNAQGNKYKRAVFSNEPAAETVGDLRKGEWTKAIDERHRWLLENSEYIWSFIQGAFDGSGYISKPGIKHDKLVFHTSRRNNAEFILSLLQSVGVTNPGILHRKGGSRSEITGVYVSNLQGIKEIASRISSVISDKEQRLAAYRDLQLPPKYKADRPPTPTTEAVLAEWDRLCKQLGHPPTSSEIQELKKAGETPYSHHVYITKFGKEGGKRSFLTAKERIQQARSDEHNSANTDNI